MCQGYILHTPNKIQYLPILIEVSSEAQGTQLCSRMFGKMVGPHKKDGWSMWNIWNKTWGSLNKGQTNKSPSHSFRISSKQSCEPTVQEKNLPKLAYLSSPKANWGHSCCLRNLLPCTWTSASVGTVLARMCLQSHGLDHLTIREFPTLCIDLPFVLRLGSEDGPHAHIE